MNIQHSMLNIQRKGTAGVGPGIITSKLVGENNH